MELGDIWAKRLGHKGGSGPYHPLLCHLVDVAEVSTLLLAEVTSPAALRWIADGLQLDIEDAKRWLAIFAGFHDIGKACRGFQEQIAKNAQETPHGTVSARILRDSLTQPPFDLERKFANRISLIIGGHHGIIPKNGHVNAVKDKTSDSVWRRTWPQLTERLLSLYPVPEQRPSALDNARAMWIAGFISAVDWVGSNTSYFPYAAFGGYVPDGFSLASYQHASARSARTALRELGWLATPSSIDERTFEQLFDFIQVPNDLQRNAIQIAREMGEPGLVIVEAPMGEGKTEVALYLADAAGVHLEMRGAYIALPTMATSNQMFGRVRDFLSNRYQHDNFIQLQLLHGHAAMSEDVEALNRNFDEYLTFTDHLEGIDGAGDHAELASAVASSWFGGRKRGMLSPFGVGTIDQSLLAILPIRHYFVRLFGLSNKVIVLDEVHAYDAYMTTLLERLLGWLAAMNCHVILLSATLPKTKRNRLLAAYRRKDSESLGADEEPPQQDSLAYPCISWTVGGRSGGQAVGVSDRGRKHLKLRWLQVRDGADGSELAHELNRTLIGGGCAAVVCNTVHRAQEVYQAIADSGLFGEQEIGLFHARFLFKDRREIERSCLEQFGKPAGDGTNPEARPLRMVLVATQVIEQSLDLDFDLMITEMAPIDLLLQRSGRMHRHPRPSRPEGLEEPQLWILEPEVEDELPSFGRGTEYVYAPHILLRTWLQLKERDKIDVPEDVSELIEAVYGDGASPEGISSAMATHWVETAAAMNRNEVGESRIAEIREIRAPDFGGELAEMAPLVYEDEDADVGLAIKAQTRLAEPTVTVVCHYGTLCDARFEPDGPSFDLTQPTRDLVRRCLEHSVSISRRDVVNDLLIQNVHRSWAKNSFLRAMRSVSLDEEEPVPSRGWRLVVDSKLGVRIESIAEG